MKMTQSSLRPGVEIKVSGKYIVRLKDSNQDIPKANTHLIVIGRMDSRESQQYGSIMHMLKEQNITPE